MSQLLVETVCPRQAPLGHAYMVCGHGHRVLAPPPLGDYRLLLTSTIRQGLHLKSNRKGKQGTVFLDLDHHAMEGVPISMRWVSIKADERWSGAATYVQTVTGVSSAVVSLEYAVFSNRH